MHVPADSLLRLALAVLAILFLRDGYAGLRGRELWLQNKGFAWVRVRSWQSRFLGGFLIVVALVFLGIAWRGVS
jgi:hypothetical protein